MELYIIIQPKEITHVNQINENFRGFGFNRYHSINSIDKYWDKNYSLYPVYQLNFVINYDNTYAFMFSYIIELCKMIRVR